jgi:hypothetical protein
MDKHRHRVTLVDQVADQITIIGYCKQHPAPISARILIHEICADSEYTVGAVLRLLLGCGDPTCAHVAKQFLSEWKDDHNPVKYKHMMGRRYPRMIRGEE